MMNLSATHAVSVNPTTGEVVSSLPWASEREVDAAIALAAAGYRQWRQTPLADRADALRPHRGRAARPWRRGGPDDHP
ncbi:aldehyde dehydrogenase family protein [Klebsiella pneumoniae]|nr:aldehyde dehydrogenase family protein [Klebsiella pneumoniae]